MHGLKSDLLVRNRVTKRRHGLTSTGVRVPKETLRDQLRGTGHEHIPEMPYHKMILKDEIPLGIGEGTGGGIGQSRTYQYLLRMAALGECPVTVWPKQIHEICAKHDIHPLR